mmetsp:Transcript_16404/g.19399  ORF Transcript_16404/g.19399 Transcript_16404/m.19399 type:complete len:102 (+) Transcript_16404:796-1101(+)
MSGVGFEFGDQIYDQPNRTMGSFAEGIMKKGKDKGFKKEIRGYWVDVVNGPFVSFGVDCDRVSDFDASIIHASLSLPTNLLSSLLILSWVSLVHEIYRWVV